MMEDRGGVQRRESAAVEIARMSAAVPAGVQRLDVLLDGSDAFGDATDLPLIAFNVAAGCSEPVRSVLGEIIARESVVGLWNEHTATSPLQVFDAWAEQVRAVSMRLAGAFRHRYNPSAKPWSQ